MSLVQSIALSPASGLALVEAIPLSTLDIPDQELPADALPPSDFFELTSKKGIVSNAMLARFLIEEKSDRARAAKRAGLAESTVARRVEAAKKGNPLFTHKRIRIYCRVDDVTLAAALARHGGNRRLAAKEVGLSPSSVAERILKVGEDSPLFPYKTQKGVGRHPLKVSNEALDLGVRQSGGNAAVVAETYGVSPSGLNMRIRNAHSDDPHLAHLKGRRVKKRNSRARRTSGDSVRRNCFLFALQMQAAPDASPVARVARDRMPDARIAEVLNRHPSDVVGAARELGVIPEVITKRLQILRGKPEWMGQSPLARFV